MYQKQAGKSATGSEQQHACRWGVGLLSEMPPEGKVGVSAMCILGVNINRGQEISLRLRTDDLKGFRRYDRIRETLCHELAHMVRCCCLFALVMPSFYARCELSCIFLPGCNDMKLAAGHSCNFCSQRGGPSWYFWLLQALFYFFHLLPKAPAWLQWPCSACYFDECRCCKQRASTC